MLWPYLSTWCSNEALFFEALVLQSLLIYVPRMPVTYTYSLCPLPVVWQADAFLFTLPAPEEMSPAR